MVRGGNRGSTIQAVESQPLSKEGEGNLSHILEVLPKARELMGLGMKT